MKNGKHAYMIMAHNNFVILEKLIRLLDDERNDIYIHINYNVKKFEPDKYRLLAEKSRVIFIDRIRVRWGEYSQIKCVLNLLKAATKEGYDYYHLMSGVDLPLKTQDQIHEFFDENDGKEFVHFDSKRADVMNINRIKYFHLIQGRPGSKILRGFISGIGILTLALEKALRINRLQSQTFQLQKGSNEFSITDSLAKYILSQEALIQKTFLFTSCGDEMFVHTLVWNSIYKEKLYYKKFDNNYTANMRYIDWNRGKPYVWKNQDYDDLVSSDYMFARKFDYNVDSEIVKEFIIILCGCSVNR